MNPSLAKASAAVIRYGLRAVVFIILYGRQLPAEPTEFSPMDSPENSGFDEMTSTLSVGRNVDGLESTPSTGA